jgi:hypothetical protein
MDHSPSDIILLPSKYIMLVTGITIQSQKKRNWFVHENDKSNRMSLLGG